jgi:hypothetical protein
MQHKDELVILFYFGTRRVKAGQDKATYPQV